MSAVQSKTPWSSSEDESGEEVEIFHIDEEKGYANKPFVLKGKFNRKPFHAIIDTGSPITIFTKAHVEKMFGKNYKMQTLGEDEKYVDNSRNKIEFAEAIIGQVEAGHGKVEGHEIKAHYKAKSVSKQQKGRRIHLQLQNSVEKELQKLIKNRHIEKISEIKDDVFIQPTGITQ